MQELVKYLGDSDQVVERINGVLEVGKDLIKQSMKIDKVTVGNSGQASDLRAMLKSNHKQLEEIRKEIVNPYNTRVKQINKLFREKYLSDPKKAIDNLSAKITVYIKDQERMQRAMEEAALSDIEDEKEKKHVIEASKTKGPETIRGAYGHKTHTRKVWKYKVTDLSKVPSEYITIDHKSVMDAISDGTREIEGLDIYQDTVIATR